MRMWNQARVAAYFGVMSVLFDVVTHWLQASILTHPSHVFVTCCAEYPPYWWCWNGWCCQHRGEQEWAAYVHMQRCSVCTILCSIAYIACVLKFEQIWLVLCADPTGIWCICWLSEWRVCSTYEALLFCATEVFDLVCGEFSESVLFIRNTKSTCCLTRRFVAQQVVLYWIFVTRIDSTHGVSCLVLAGC